MATSDLGIEKKPYVKTFEDELDWKLLDQLYGVVSQISNFCFEIKKYCVAIQFIVLTFIAKFTQDKLDHAFFVAGFFIPLCFWFLDAVAFFYQVKLRGTMASIQENLKKRNVASLIYISNAPHIIDNDRTDRKFILRVFDSAFNHSMWIYFFLIVFDLFAWILFIKGVIP